MELRYREDWRDFVTEKQALKREQIMKKVDRTHRLSYADGDFLVEFDKKTRLCNTCGKPFSETKGWVHATLENPDGTEVSCGLFANCFECDMKEIMMKGAAGLL
jgi:NADH pyrophosphatase NudC (nudix superfamily)